MPHLSAVLPTNQSETFSTPKNAAHSARCDAASFGPTHDQVIYRGHMDDKQLSVWWLKKRTLCAALIMTAQRKNGDMPRPGFYDVLG
jgi:hypothetical protein